MKTGVPAMAWWFKNLTSAAQIAVEAWVQSPAWEFPYPWV